MLQILIRKYIRQYKEVENPEVRGAYGRLAGLLGIVCNMILFLLKLIAGLLAGSIAIMSDAFNNLSDMGASVISLVGVTAAGRHADEEHPFGHGRSEYIASLIVSFIIMLVGFELFRTSVGKIFHGDRPAVGILQFAILGISVLIKLWMFFANRHIGKTICSSLILAAAQDSLNDVWATLAVMVSGVVGLYTAFPVDGVAGVLISALIMWMGFGIAKETITVLLGAAPDPQMSARICELILEQEEIQGVHDLILHDYGPGRSMGSVHAEVPMDGNIVKIHEVIDAVEKEIQKELGVHMVIHMDPISVNNARIQAVRDLTLRCVQEVNCKFGIHDFRMTEGEFTINLIFDLEVPYSLQNEERALVVADIRERLKAHDKRFEVVIEVDNKYI
ncbi:MAG: cation transporter [Ruminococcaceae bacterium]|nr:cation transporter [Oscillospiraceae bacterium]